MTPQCPNGITTLVKTKGLQKGDEVGFLKEACEFIQACRYNGPGHGRTQNKLCVEMSSLWSQPHLQSSPPHPSPYARATSFLDHILCIPPFLGYSLTGFWIGRWEFWFSDTPEKSRKLNPKEVKRWKQDRWMQLRPGSPGSHEMVVRGGGSRKEVQIWLFAEILGCIPFSSFKDNRYQDTYT